MPLYPGVGSLVSSSSTASEFISSTSTAILLQVVKPVYLALAKATASTVLCHETNNEMPVLLQCTSPMGFCHWLLQKQNLLKDWKICIKLTTDFRPAFLTYDSKWLTPGIFWNTVNQKSEIKIMWRKKIWRCKDQHEKKIMSEICLMDYGKGTSIY